MSKILYAVFLESEDRRYFIGADTTQGGVRVILESHPGARIYTATVSDGPIELGTIPDSADDPFDTPAEGFTG